MRIVSKTDVGKVRRSNQDSYATGELPGSVAWAVVCDGMGGASGGNVASAAAVKVISEQINASVRERMNPNTIRTILGAAISAANAEVYKMACSNASLAGMGTTVVVAMVVDKKAYIAHAGDSRAYILSKDRILQITRDHSIVQHLIEDGKLTEEQAKTHPQKNIITRALGVNEKIVVDYNDADLTEDDAILMCTDGLSGYVDKDNMLELFKECKFYDYPDKLVRAANKNGGGDNITVVLLSL